MHSYLMSMHALETYCHDCFNNGTNRLEMGLMSLNVFDLHVAMAVPCMA